MKTVQSVGFLLAVMVWAAAASATIFVVPSDDSMIARSEAIVIARATSSHVESETAIDTITTFAVEEVLKGDPSLAGGLEIREPGGVYEKDGRKTFRIVPGSPRFVDGERVLLMIGKVRDGKYAVAELALGCFTFADDDFGHRLVARPFAAGHSLKRDGTAYVEPKRDAERFVIYIRNVSSGRPSAPDYIMEPETATSTPHIGSMSLRPAPATMGGDIVQYSATIDFTETGPGSRWEQFPAEVWWNRGSASTASNSGNDAINNAFTQWAASGSTVNYVLKAFEPKWQGVVEPADGTNNIVFEKDFTPFGVSAYVCGDNAGIVALSTFFVAGTHVFRGQMFQNITEADIAFNEGVNVCVTNGSLTDTNYRTYMSREVGASLGLRYSNLTRDRNRNCASENLYDCEFISAVMTSQLTSNLGGVLQPWDERAITTLYQNLSAPDPVTAVEAKPASSTSVLVSWTAPAIGVVSKYHVYRCSNAGCTSFARVNGETTTTTFFTDTTVAANTAYVYKVRSVDASNVESYDSDRDLATTTIFTDSITAGVSTVRNLHVTELRTAVTAVCTLANNPPPCSTAFTDPSITQYATSMKAAHINQLRAKLDAARSALQLPALTYTDGPAVTANTTVIKRAHIMELRAGVQ